MTILIIGDYSIVYVAIGLVFYGERRWHDLKQMLEVR